MKEGIKRKGKDQRENEIGFIWVVYWERRRKPQEGIKVLSLLPGRKKMFEPLKNSEENCTTHKHNDFNDFMPKLQINHSFISIVQANISSSWTQVPRGLDHEDTCIFYNHLYVYEKEEVFAETLAPIIPTIKQEVVNLDEQLPDSDTISNDDTSSQYSSLSRRERNLYSSLKAQQYYESKLNNNEDSLDFGFDSTYETLRKKRQSYTDDEDPYRPISPTSSSGRSESFSYAKPRLLRKSDVFPGVGKEVNFSFHFVILMQGVCPLLRPPLKSKKERYQNLDCTPLSMLKTYCQTWSFVRWMKSKAKRI